MMIAHPDNDVAQARLLGYTVARVLASIMPVALITVLVIGIISWPYYYPTIVVVVVIVAGLAMMTCLGMLVMYCRLLPHRGVKGVLNIHRSTRIGLLQTVQELNDGENVLGLDYKRELFKLQAAKDAAAAAAQDESLGSLKARHRRAIAA